jgi:hypothetical protein
MLARVLAALAAAVALAACSSAPTSSGGGTGGGPALLDQVGAKFTSKLDVNIDLDTAAKATPAAAAATRSALRDQGFSGGQERVWVNGDEYITVLELSLSTTVGAAQIVSFEQAQLHSALGANVYPDPQIPDAVAFDLAGQTRAGNRNAFCQGVWFPLGTAAYEVDDCAGSPRYPELVMALALRQYQLAGGQPPA